MRQVTIVLGLAALLLSTCSTRTRVVKELTRPVVESRLVQAIVSDDLSDELQVYLKSKGIDQGFGTSPVEIVTALAEQLGPNPSGMDRLYLAQLCAKAGESLKERDTTAAIGCYLDAARLTLDPAIASAREEGEPPARIVYNQACWSVGRLLFESGGMSVGTSSFRGPVSSFSLAVKTDGPGLSDPAYFDTLVAADFLKFKGFKQLTRIREPGLGGSMVGHREGSKDRQLKEPLLHPKVGVALPVTVSLEFGSGRSGEFGAELALHDTQDRGEIVLAGSSVPVASDLTAPLAYLYNFADAGDVGLRDMKDSIAAEQKTGLYMLEPIRNDQIPIVFVHGLKSTADVWVEAVNRLRTDPILRERYQLLVFSYPTGFPISMNAAALRKHLARFREHYNPGGKHAALSNMVLVGHSMGGILSNYQVRDSGQTLHNLLFERPLDEIELSDRQREVLEAVLYFKANPDIKRVAFVATPHNGSSMALGLIGAFGRKLIRLPIEALFGQPFEEVEGMTETGRRLAAENPNSIRGLQPNSLVLRTVWDLPNTYNVPLHSIIARKKASGPLEESTDGVVAYESAHIDQAVSEKVVAGQDHRTITSADGAIAELRRILYLHIGKSE